MPNGAKNFSYRSGTSSHKDTTENRLEEHRRTSSRMFVLLWSFLSLSYIDQTNMNGYCWKCSFWCGSHWNLSVFCVIVLTWTIREGVRCIDRRKDPKLTGKTINKYLIVVVIGLLSFLTLSTMTNNYQHRTVKTFLKNYVLSSTLMHMLTFLQLLTHLRLLVSLRHPASTIPASTRTDPSPSRTEVCGCTCESRVKRPVKWWWWGCSCLSARCTKLMIPGRTPQQM